MTQQPRRTRRNIEESKMTRYLKDAMLGKSIATFRIKRQGTDVVITGATADIDDWKRKIVISSWEFDSFANQVRNFVEAGCKNRVEINFRRESCYISLENHYGQSDKVKIHVYFGDESQKHHFGTYSVEDFLDLLNSI